MWKKVALGIGAVIVIFLIVVAMQPATYRVTRSGTIQAPPAVVFAHVNDLRAWDNWSPWAKLDPKATAVFEGQPTGEGSKFKWSGNDEVGEGSMTITESKPAERIKIKLEFVRPFAGTSDTEFAFKPEGAGTVVSWTMSGENNFMGKLFCLFMDQDKMLGGMFEKGLANMKTAVENSTTMPALPATTAAATQP